MVKRANQACPGLAGFVSILCGVMIAVGVLSFLIIMINDMDHFLIALSCLLGSGLTVLLIYLEYVIAAHFYGAAADKGYPDPFYLKLAFWIPVIGYLLVIALPNRGSGGNVVSDYDDSLPDL